MQTRLIRSLTWEQCSRHLRLPCVYFHCTLLSCFPALVSLLSHLWFASIKEVPCGSSSTQTIQLRKLRTHYRYQSNISDCQLWEVFDCSWRQFASCLSWLLCINIPPSNPPRCTVSDTFPPSTPVLLLLSGASWSGTAAAAGSVCSCTGAPSVKRGEAGRQTAIFYSTGCWACLVVFYRR